MPSAIELSVKFGLPVPRIEEIFRYVNFELDEPDFDTGKEFEILARAVKRKRASSYVLAFLVEHATTEQREFILALDTDFAAEYAALDLPIVSSELLPNAKQILDVLANDSADKRKESIALAQWCERVIRNAGKPVGHAYLAVRMLLSLEPKEMSAYPQTIASVFNRLRHRGFLDGWHKVKEIKGKNVVFYSNPDAAPVLPWLTAERVQAAAKLLNSTEVVNIAGYLAATEKSDFEDIKKVLEMRPELIFSAIPLDL